MLILYQYATLYSAVYLHRNHLKKAWSLTCIKSVLLCVLNSEELDKFMESQGASTPGILTLTTSLSKPFMRLDKYPTLLQELERHVEVQDEMSKCLNIYWKKI